MAGFFASNGYPVICMDIDTHKINSLQRQELPIYEEGLFDALFSTKNNHKVLFTNDGSSLTVADIIYLCVATPLNAEGFCDCTFLEQAFKSVIALCPGDASKIICIKSTVPPGTLKTLKHFIPEEKIKAISLLYNPEFMREGSALYDVYHTNPIVLGGDSSQAIETVAALHTAIVPNVPVIKTTTETAELIKYAWNAFSALRIAYVNELALFCTLWGADIMTVIQGFALSEVLLPTAVIKPGPGFGGSCLPKDTKAFTKALERKECYATLVHAAIESNNRHKNRLTKIILDNICDLPYNHKPIVTLLGASFKANTNDIRNSPILDIIPALFEHNAEVHVYDPQAMVSIKELFPDVVCFDCPYKAVECADCIVALTDWSEIKELDLEKVADLCTQKILIDTRNMYALSYMKQCGFICFNLGML